MHDYHTLKALRDRASAEQVEQAEINAVGRHLQGHLYLSTFGIFDTLIINAVCPNARIATCCRTHRRLCILGGVLANEILKLPIIRWNWALPPDAERADLAGKTPCGSCSGARATSTARSRR